MLNIDDVETLRCPKTASHLSFEGDLVGGRLHRGHLVNAHGRRWEVVGGVPRLFEGASVGRMDRGFRFIYDRFAPFHDVSVRYLLPLLQLSGERQLRAFYMERMELERAGVPGEPLRILETGIGAGANIPLLAEFLPRDREAEIWGIDLSEGMMRRSIRRVAAGEGGRRIRFVLADAHYLPFPDNYFDRVFHVGATNTFSNPRLALAEMSRVAKRGTPIVVVDEHLDPRARKNLYLRAGFRFITFYDPNPSIPVELLPPEATAVRAEQINSFFYCLTWQV